MGAASEHVEGSPDNHGASDSDSDEGGRGPGSVISVASSRRLMGTDDERESQYAALRSQFARGKSLKGRGGHSGGGRGSHGKPPPASPPGRATGAMAGAGASSSKRPGVSPTSVVSGVSFPSSFGSPPAAAGASAHHPPLPRVAFLQRRSSELTAPVEEKSTKRTPTAAESEIYDRLHVEGVEKEERLKRMREELQEREVAECKQFLAVPNRTHVSRAEDGRRVHVGVRLYQTGVRRVSEKDRTMEVMKANLDKIVPWACSLCAHMNDGVSETCQNVVKSGGRATKRLGSGPQSVEVCICAMPRPAMFKPNLASTEHGDVPSTADHLKRFEEQKARLQEQRLRLRAKADEEFRRQCTFHPHINQTSSALMTEVRASPSNQGSVHQRLFEEASRLQAKQRAREKDANKIEKFTFQPELFPRKEFDGLMRTGGNVYDRLHASYIASDKKLHELQERATDGWFVPQTFPSTLHIDRPKNVPVWDLLFAKRHRMEDIRKALQEETLTSRMALTTSTHILASSKRLADRLWQRALARVFRRLQRSVSLSPQQQAAIVRRQHALGLREMFNRPKDREQQGGAESVSGPATIDRGSSRRISFATPDARAWPRGTSTTLGSPSGVSTGALSLGSTRSVVLPRPSVQEVFDDVDYVSVESDDSEDDHVAAAREKDEAKTASRSPSAFSISSRRRGGGGGGALGSPSSPRTAVTATTVTHPHLPRKRKSDAVSVPGVLDVTAAWTGVLHPYVESQVAPALRFLRRHPTGYPSDGAAASASSAAHGSGSGGGSASSSASESDGEGEASLVEVTFDAFVAAVNRTVNKAAPPMRLYSLTKKPKVGKLAKELEETVRRENPHQPKLVPANAAAVSSVGPRSFDVQFDMARVYTENKKRLALERERVQKETCTFKPTLYKSKVVPPATYAALPGSPTARAQSASSASSLGDGAIRSGVAGTRPSPANVVRSTVAPQTPGLAALAGTPLRVSTAAPSATPVPVSRSMDGSGQPTPVRSNAALLASVSGPRPPPVSLATPRPHTASSSGVAAPPSTSASAAPVAPTPTATPGSVASAPAPMPPVVRHPPSPAFEGVSASANSSSLARATTPPSPADAVAPPLPRAGSASSSSAAALSGAPVPSGPSSSTPPVAHDPVRSGSSASSSTGSPRVNNEDRRSSIESRIASLLQRKGS